MSFSQTWQRRLTNKSSVVADEASQDCRIDQQIDMNILVQGLFSTLVGRLGQRHIIISFFALAELALSGGVAAYEAASGHRHMIIFLVFLVSQ